MVQEGVALMVKLLILSATQYMLQNWISDTYDVCNIKTIIV